MGKKRKWLAGEVWWLVKWLTFWACCLGAAMLIVTTFFLLLQRVYLQAVDGDWAGVGIITALVAVMMLWAYYDREDEHDGDDGVPATTQQVD